MSNLLTAIAALYTGLIFAQESSCYCYENSETKYVEWICFFEDSVFVQTETNKTCEDRFNLSEAMKFYQKEGMIWPVIKIKTEVSFTRKLSSQVEFQSELIPIEIECQYIGKIKRGKMVVHIETPSSFTDYSGPPDRVYNMITGELK